MIIKIAPREDTEQFLEDFIKYRKLVSEAVASAMMHYLQGFKARLATLERVAAEAEIDG